METDILLNSRDEIEMRSMDPMQGAPVQESELDRSSWFQKLKDHATDVTNRIDDGVGRSSVGKLFQLQGSGHVRSKQTLPPDAREC